MKTKKQVLTSLSAAMLASMILVQQPVGAVAGVGSQSGEIVFLEDVAGAFKINLTTLEANIARLKSSKARTFASKHYKAVSNKVIDFVEGHVITSYRILSENQSSDKKARLIEWAKQMLHTAPEIGSYLKRNVRNADNNAFLAITHLENAWDVQSLEEVLALLQEREIETVEKNLQDVVDVFAKEAKKLVDQPKSVISSSEKAEEVAPQAAIAPTWVASIGMTLTEAQEETAVALSKRFKGEVKNQFKEIKRMTMISPVEFHSMVHSDQRSESGMIENEIGLGILPLNNEWAWVGGKPGGVEGGFTARRIPPKDLSTLFEANQEAREVLAQLTAENSEKIPADLRGKALEELTAEERSALAVRVIDEMPMYKKTYIFKVVFGREDKKLGRFFKPNPKGFLHRNFTSRTAATINAEVLLECASLSVARAIDSEIAPNFVLGRVNSGRWFLGTEVIGAGDPDEKFENFGERTMEKVEEDLEAIVNRELAEAAFGTTVLLGDRDANKPNNIGMLKQGRKIIPIQFDLGHAEPLKYTLDAATFLPKGFVKSGSNGFFVGGMIDGLTIDERKAGLQKVVAQRVAIESALQELLGKIGENADKVKLINQFKKDIQTNIGRIETIVQ